MTIHSSSLLRLFLFSIQIMLIVANLGCSREDKTPHLRDPIYLDLKRSYDRAVSEVEAAAKQIEELESDYSKSEVRTIDRKMIQKELNDARRSHQLALQQREYYKAKLRLREAEAKISYKRAFFKNQPWPDPKEYDSYQLQKQLRESSRNWSDRLMKSGDSHHDIVSLPDSSGSNH